MQPYSCHLSCCTDVVLVPLLIIMFVVASDGLSLWQLLIVTKYVEWTLIVGVGATSLVCYVTCSWGCELQFVHIQHVSMSVMSHH